MRKITYLAALATLAGLAGCVGAPPPGPAPVAYTPGYAVPAGPAYAAPPVAYAPPGPGYAPPGPGYAPVAAGYGSTCYAGVYTCAVPGGTPVGAQCSCPGLGAPSYGVAR